MFNIKEFGERKISLAIATILICTPTMGIADETNTEKKSSLVLDEITVTARKRAEGLQDVPISISAVRGEEIQSGNYSDLTDISSIIPNFTHAEATASSDQFMIRGLGTSGVNPGFEQAVGQVIDGVYYGRSRFGRTAFLDLERIEVLKGPQGALIGKNTSVGAINYTTRKPSEEFKGYALVTGDFEDADGVSVEGAVSVPLSDKFRVRFSGRYENRNGWVMNTATGEKEQQREDVTFRAIAHWDVSEDMNIEMMYQLGDIKHIGRNRELYNCEEDAASVTPFDPGEDCSFNGVRDVLFEINGEVTPESHDTKYDLVHLNISYDYDSFVVNSLTGYAQFKAVDLWDTDMGPLERTHFSQSEEYEQFSQELRITSTSGEELDYIAGLYFSDTKIDGSSRIMFCRGPNQNLICNPEIAPIFNGITRDQSYISNAQTISAFAQFDWHFDEQWTATLGGRYTNENKDTTGHQRPTLPYDVSSVVDCTNVSDTLDGQGVNPGHPCRGPVKLSNTGSFDRTTNNFSPNFTLRYQPDGDTTYYATVSKGFKSGGFILWPNASQATLADSIEFGDETTFHIELGGKHDIFDGSGRFNWAFWRTKFTDIQVSSLDPVDLVQRISNAAEATSQGIEADFKMIINENLSTFVTGAYTDASFDSFAGAACYSGQTEVQGCIGGVQDLAGVRLQYAPEFQYSIGLDGQMPIGESLEAGFKVLWHWRSDQFLQLDHDPLDTQESFGKLNLSFSLSDVDNRWTISLIGKNLTDKLTANFSNDTTASGQSGDNGTATPHFKFSEVGRQIGLQLRVIF